MPTEREQLELLRAIDAARQAGDSRAELEAMRQYEAGAIIPNGQPHDITRQSLMPGVDMSAIGGSDDARALPQIGRAAATQFAGNAMALPELASDVMALTQGGMQQLPRFQEKNLPLPSGEQVIAGIGTATEIPGALLAGEPLNIGERFQQQQAQAALAAQEQPIATGVGGLLGDAATIATGRAPFAGTGIAGFLRGRQPAEMAFGSAAKFANRTELDRFIQSAPVQKLARGAGRSLEAGFEGATLALLNEGDPLKTAAYAAGGQAVGSAAISATSLRGGALNIAGRAAGLTAMIQLTKSAIPGGRDRILESTEKAFDDLKLAITFGIAARTVGAGRVSGRAADRFEKSADAISTLHRGIAISTIQDATNDDTGTVEKVLQHLSINPDTFTQEQLDRFSSGLDNRKFGATVKDMIADDPSLVDLIDSQPKRPSAQAAIRSDISADNEGARLASSRDVAGILQRHVQMDASRGSHQFISAVFKDEAAISKALRNSGKHQRLDILEKGLDVMLRDAVRDQVIDGKALEKTWNSLPQVARNGYSRTQRENVEAFIDLAKSEPVFSLPPMLARSLMLTDGELSRRLHGE
ncbi:MAG: hypothetical protein WD795_00665 [Woeseia sp.]